MVTNFPVPVKPRQIFLPIYDKQKAFLDATTNIQAFVGGRGSGKSWVGAYKFLRMVQPGRFYLIGAPTFPVLRDATLRSFLSIAKKLDMIRPGGFKASSMSLATKNGAEVIFRSAHEPDRFRGPNLSGAWLDEASQISREAYTTLLPCLREGEFGEIGQMGFQFATFTPRGTSHWTYDVFAKKDPVTNQLPPHKFLVKASSKENPFLPPEYYDLMLAEIGPTLAPQELDAEFTDTIGSIFKYRWFCYWRRDREYFWIIDSRGMERSVDPKKCNIFLMVDLASSLKQTADCTAIGVFMDDRHGNLLMVDLVMERMEAPDISRVIWQKFTQWGASFVGIESVAGQQLFIQTERDKGLPVQAMLRRRGEDKLGRAIPATVRMEAGQIFFPHENERAKWFPALKDQVLQFPLGEFDDGVDVLSDAAGWMATLYRGAGSPIGYRQLGVGVELNRMAGLLGG